MSTDENKATARRFVEEVVNKGKFEVFDELVAADYNAQHPDPLAAREGFKMAISELRTAFPDLHYHIDLEVAEGDKVVQRVTGHGTMKGAYQGEPATGKTGTWTETHILRMAGGKFMEHWADVDQLGRFISLGVMPPPAARAK